MGGVNAPLQAEVSLARPRETGWGVRPNAGVDPVTADMSVNPYSRAPLPRNGDLDIRLGTRQSGYMLGVLTIGGWLPPNGHRVVIHNATRTRISSKSIWGDLDAGIAALAHASATPSCALASGHSPLQWEST